MNVTKELIMRRLEEKAAVVMTLRRGVCLASDQARWETGAELVIDGGDTAR